MEFETEWKTMNNTLNIYFHDEKTCMWKPADLSRKIEILVSDGKIEETDYFLGYTEYVPSPDGGKTICEEYVRGGLCIIQFCKHEIEPGSLMTVGDLIKRLSSEKTCSECGKGEGIARIGYTNPPIVNKKDVYIIRI